MFVKLHVILEMLIETYWTSCLLDLNPDVVTLNTISPPSSGINCARADRASSGPSDILVKTSVVVVSVPGGVDVFAVSS